MTPRRRPKPPASVKRAVRAAELKPTPAQIVAALARIGREMGQ